MKLEEIRRLAKETPMQWETKVVPTRVYNTKTREYETVMQEARVISAISLKRRARKINRRLLCER